MRAQALCCSCACNELAAASGEDKNLYRADIFRLNEKNGYFLIVTIYESTTRRRRAYKFFLFFRAQILYMMRCESFRISH